MKDERFETWWASNPARVTLNPAAKEVARGIWHAACEDSAYLLTMSASLMDEAAKTLSVVPPAVLDAIPVHRWPLSDELGGAALLCRDAIPRFATRGKGTPC